MQLPLLSSCYLSNTAPSQPLPDPLLFIQLAECLTLEWQWNGLFLHGAE